MDSTQSNDRRRFQRFLFDGTAQLRYPDGRTAETRLVDLSLQGVCIEQPEGAAPAPGDIVEVMLTLADDLHIHMTAAVVYQANGTLGCACRFIDVHSMTTLKRIVELNLGDPDLLDRELSALMEQ